MSIPTVPPQPPSGLLRFFANVGVVYPLALVGLLYAEWLLAWHLLGHEPQWSVDDPKSIDGSNLLHVVTQCGVFGMLLAWPASLALNIAYVIQYRPSVVQAGI